ncbi:MipA/OmpV family protein [Planctobacterium marinum]|uniref:MipA/OmpV family protein n=1 Tax=Planctobacterium marinum TaxID=1631968 RepID=UPI001E386D29|nr:MipA/OmpV family protein [Planctobacterium marinum]MCC2607004.1 MipA/OmpV family protein [Planctobacterium marinum]
MDYKHTFNLLILGLLLLLPASLLQADEVSESGDSELESFFAISLIGGVSETNQLDQNFNRVNTTESFLAVNLEMQLRWKGFFYENPGNSQENVDGLFSGDAIGYNFYNTRNWAVDLYAVHAHGGGEFVFDGIEQLYDEEGEPAGINVHRLTLPRDSNYRLGVRATGYFSDYLMQFIATPVSFEDEIGGFGLSASIRRTWLYKNWNFYGTVGLNYQSSDIIDYYWGLSDSESAQIEDHMRRTDTPYKPYEADGGVMAVGQVGFEYPLTEHLVFGGFITSVLRPDAVTDSPLSSEGRLVSTAGLSVTYVF